MMIKVVSYHPIETTGTLIGIFQIYIEEWHLTIDRMGEFKKDDKHWVSLPSYSKQDPDYPDKWNFFPTLFFEASIQKKFLNSCKKALIEYKNKTSEDGKNPQQMTFLNKDN